MTGLQTTWCEDYLRECFADEIELARVKHGYRVMMPSVINAVIQLTPEPPKFGSPQYHRSRTSLTGLLPAWRRNWTAAGPLSVELGLTITHDKEERTVSAGAGNRRRNVTESYADHPSEDAATMAAIVRAAIQLLESYAAS